jgi:hypothetical protein
MESTRIQSKQHTKPNTQQRILKERERKATAAEYTSPQTHKSNGAQTLQEAALQ